MSGAVATALPGFTLRPAGEADAPELLRFIRALAAYEKLDHEVQATEDLLREHLFGAKPHAEALLGELDGRAVCFAVYFHNFSTFAGKPGLYLEDLFVLPEMRGRGFGGAVLAHLARLALERGCARLEWSVLDWNRPAWDFYAALGARPMDEWTLHRVSGDALVRLASR